MSNHNIKDKSDKKDIHSPIAIPNITVHTTTANSNTNTNNHTNELSSHINPSLNHIQNTLHFRSIQDPYTVHDESDRYSVYSTLNTKDVPAMLSGGLDRFYEKYQQISRGVSMHLATPEVRFENLSYTVECPISSHGNSAATVGSYLCNIITPWKKQASKLKKILHSMSGIIKPGSMTLVLGGPGSGKSTFLKALAGRLKTDKRHELQGKILYSGLTQDQLELSKLVGLVDQTDNHCATLSVRETFKFADTCLNGLVINQPEQIRSIAALRTELMIHLLGLNNCADTVVGDALLRGVSGGERKRVTIGEMLVGGQSVFLCDEISTGLDSAATFDIMNSLRTWTKTLGGTAIVALLQPPPEVVELFDDILLMNDGQLVYHGPRHEILGHFQSLGFTCPLKIDPADFLVDVCSGRGYQYRNGEVRDADLPLNTSDFAKFFYESDICKRIHQELSKGFNLPTTYETAEHFQQFKSVANLAYSKGASPFPLSIMDSLQLLIKRQGTVFIRDKPLIYGKLAEAIVVGLVLGMVYYKADKSLYLRMLFFSIAVFQRQAWQQIPIAFQLRSVFYKQRSRNFFRTTVYSVADAIIQVPINLVVSLLMGTIFYFMSGLYADAGTFFTYLLVLIAFQHAIGAYFTFLSALSPSITVAQGLAAASVCFFLLFSGNIILPNLIPTYWKWMFWFDPISWALRSVIINEFTSKRYSAIDSAAKLKGFQVNYGDEFIWYGIIVLWLYYIGFTSFQALGLHYIRFDNKKRLAAPGEEDNIHNSTINRNEPEKPHALTSDNNNHNDDTVVDVSHVKYNNIKSGNATVNNTNEDDHNFIPAYLAIKNLKYSVKGPDNNDLQLLRGVTAYFAPGTMTALMGSSGAGKTTLMDVIAGRKTGGTIEGQVLVNGIPKNPKTFSRISGYCEQMDIHSYAATVYESLLFSANLRCPPSVSHQTKIDLVHDTLALLELEPIANRIVGETPATGLSIEQRKRLTIGVELVANPSIIFLDEPTSGLDARSAQVVMRGVQGIARSGRTVVCTIHQPSLQIFELFDRLLLLQRGGYVAYYGQLGEDSYHMLNYFASIPGTIKIQPQYNPATYMLEVIGAGIGRTGADDKITNYAEEYEKSELKMKNDNETNYYCQIQPEFKKFPDYDPIATSMINQLHYVVMKSIKTYWRSPNYNFTRLAAYPIFAIIFGTTFYQMKNESPAQINSQIALIYNSMDFIGVINLMTVLEITCAERAVFYRERMSNYYGAFPYSISLFLAEMPYLIVASFLFIVSEYFLIGLNTDPAIFFYFWFIFFIYVSICTFFGQWMSVLTPNAKVANVAVGAISAILNLFSGYLVPLPFMRSGYEWFSTILPSRYALASLVSIQLSCSGDFKNEVGCNYINVSPPIHNQTQITINDFVQYKFGINDSVRIKNIIVLIAMGIFLQIAIFLTLKYVSHLKR